MGRRRRRRNRSRKNTGVVTPPPATTTPPAGTLSEQQSQGTVGTPSAGQSRIADAAKRVARNQGWANKYSQGNNLTNQRIPYHSGGGKLSRRGIHPAGTGGRDIGFRNRAFGMGREQRGYGMGREAYQHGGRGFGMGGNFPGPGDRVAYGGQETFARGENPWGRGGRGGWGGPSEDMIQNMSPYAGGAFGPGQGGQLQSDTNRRISVRRRSLRNRRARFANQQRSAQAQQSFAPSGGGGYGGGGAPAWQSGGAYQGGYSVPAQRSFAKKVGTTQGAFRIGDPSKNIASKNNKLAINKKS